MPRFVPSAQSDRRVITFNPLHADHIAGIARLILGRLGQEARGAESSAFTSAMARLHCLPSSATTNNSARARSGV
jgi:ribonuclease BN (tRNA processing enzyme)